MKRYLSFFLCLCMVFLMFACGNNEPEVQRTPTPYDNVVADPHTWYQEFINLPIANDKMTTDELRQLVVDYFKLQLSFTWTPNKDLKYVIESKGRAVSLPAGTAYSGLCYAAGQGVLHGTGNLYKILNYYDTETGVLDVEAMGENYLGIISSQCSYGPNWAWNRVSNSIELFTMAHFVHKNGALRVGPYTYDDDNVDFSKKDATTKIVKANGDEVMLKSYAEMLPGDGLYSSPSWHVQMCSAAPVVVKNADGTINPEESYMLICEQITNGTSGWLEPVMQSNGVPMRELGGVDVKMTFKDLLKKNYIPFTIPEFVGEDPVEKGKAWLGAEDTPYEDSPYKNGKKVTLSELAQTNINGNYVISNIHLEIKNFFGKVIYSDDPYIYTRNRSYSRELAEALDVEKLSEYADGWNTIYIYAQLSNGEMVEAFHTRVRN